MHESFRRELATRFKKYGVELHHEVTLEEITDKGVVLRNKNGARYHVDGDTVIPARGLESRNEMTAQLQKEGLEVYPIGDCVRPRDIHDAVFEAFMAAWYL